MKGWERGTQIQRLWGGKWGAEESLGSSSSLRSNMIRIQETVTGIHELSNIINIPGVAAQKKVIEISRLFQFRIVSVMLLTSPNLWSQEPPDFHPTSGAKAAEELSPRASPRDANIAPRSPRNGWAVGGRRRRGLHSTADTCRNWDGYWCDWCLIVVECYLWFLWTSLYGEMCEAMGRRDWWLTCGSKSW